jgi:isoamylase
MQLIQESLRYWANECQVDGFRFDLASILTRGAGGRVLSPAPLIELLINDPLLADVKLIAEPWDAGGLYQLGGFPAWGFAAEWNGRYRDNVRKFIKGTDGIASAFATALCGSTDLYFGLGRPTCSINFITAHDGFTLHDLVSYNEKHNEDNGEKNRDGANDNESYNCGAEGPTDNIDVLFLRKKQMKNFFVTLFVSQGIPMMLMGDEYGHTKNGNNNTWCIDDERNWFSWGEAAANEPLIRFVTNLIDFRKKHPILHMPRYLNKAEIIWHGVQPNKPDWGTGSRFVACSLYDAGSHDELYIAFNSSICTLEVTLPTPQHSNRWQKVIDTAAEAPDDFMTSASPYTLHEDKIVIPPYTAIVLEASHHL